MRGTDWSELGGGCCRKRVSADVAIHPRLYLTRRVARNKRLVLFCLTSAAQLHRHTSGYDFLTMPSIGSERNKRSSIGRPDLDIETICYEQSR